MTCYYHLFFLAFLLLSLLLLSYLSQALFLSLKLSFQLTFIRHYALQNTQTKLKLVSGSQNVVMEGYYLYILSVYYIFLLKRLTLYHVKLWSCFDNLYFIKLYRKTCDLTWWSENMGLILKKKNTLKKLRKPKSAK